MPILPALAVAAPLIAGGGQAATGLIANRQNIKFAKEQMKQQREWAQSDWYQVNAYNHPSQQMARYKEAGLNPHLIYGNANNTPAGMVRTTTAEAPKTDPRGIIEGIGTAAQAPQALMAVQNLLNQTSLLQAQTANLNAQKDLAEQKFKLTGEQWDDLRMGPMFQNLRSANLMEYTDAQRNILPTRAMAWEKYLAETARTDATAKHAQSLYNLAKQEGLLKQADIDMLENLSAAPAGLKYIVEFLKIILGKF